MSTQAMQPNRAAGLLHAPRVGRRINVPVWALMIVVVWLALVGVNEWLKPADSTMPSLCHVKAVTGLPCPTCGSTRAVKAAAAGDLIGAWKVNPFVVTVALLAGAWLTWRVSTGRALIVTLPPRGRTVAWCLIALLLTANWVYLVQRGV